MIGLDISGRPRRPGREVGATDRTDERATRVRQGTEVTTPSGVSEPFGTVQRLSGPLHQTDPAISSRDGDAMTRFERITSDPERRKGQPCIRSLRLTVRRVLEALAT